MTSDTTNQPFTSQRVVTCPVAELVEAVLYKVAWRSPHWPPEVLDGLRLLGTHADYLIEDIDPGLFEAIAESAACPDCGDLCEKQPCRDHTPTGALESRAFPRLGGQPDRKAS